MSAQTQTVCGPLKSKSDAIWKVTKIVKQKCHYYPWVVSGINYADPEKPSEFYWSVPDIYNPNYDLSSVESYIKGHDYA